MLSDEHAYHWDGTTQNFKQIVFNGDNDLHFAQLWWVGTGFWALSHHELLCLVHGQFKQVTLPSDLAPQQIRGEAVGGDGTIWLATHDGRFGKLSDGRKRRKWMATQYLGTIYAIGLGFMLSDAWLA